MVVEGLAARALRGVEPQAQQLDEPERLAPGLYLDGGNAAGAPRRREPLEGVRRGHAARQRVHPRRLDEWLDTVHLQVERVRMLAAAREHEIADEAERRLVLERVLRLRREPRPKVRDEPTLAADRPEIEEDRRVEQRLRLGALDPIGELLLPLGVRKAPARVARHDLAAAQRVAAPVKREIHALRER